MLNDPRCNGYSVTIPGQGDFLASNIAKPTTNNSLAKVVGIKNATTIKNYIDFLENTYLLFQIYKFDFSVKRQIRNPRKTYFIDNAIVRRLGFLFTEESGRLLENMINHPCHPGLPCSGFRSYT